MDENAARMEWAAANGFGSFEWVGFDRGACRPGEPDWAGAADRFAERAGALGLRISAIGAAYGNPLDPAQSERLREVFLRAIEVAARIGVRTVAGFGGAVIQVEASPWGGHPVYRPFEDFLPQWSAYWQPIARAAADRGVRLAFEHCATGEFHLPVQHFNLLARPAIWERVFNESWTHNVGIEWDASHLVCQFIDPVENLHRFGSKVFHVHAKDARVNPALLARYGLCHPGVIEHRFPGLGDSNWAEIVHALLRAGYDGDLNIEGWHDPVFRDHPADASGGPLAGRRLEDAGLLIARDTLRGLVAGTE
jgi:sugar phosphate isomerase/epimerase